MRTEARGLMHDYHNVFPVSLLDGGRPGEVPDYKILD